MTTPTTFSLTTSTINQLDLSTVQQTVAAWKTQGSLSQRYQSVRFTIDYAKEPSDPRELSEIPEVRLWFIRLDVCYPWFPFLLDWEAGELARYTAMLVPHQFSRSEGIQYNPEALEIFVMQKVFVLTSWMRSHGLAGRNKLKLMTKSLGYELDDTFFDLI
ncbi:MAG: CRR6 family NdhI maturation factor [Cyanothece sp. SIO2G6]|nr:CRR6 family NdhI maturation factor [Cyanothece sp. SIO2G6]